MEERLDDAIHVLRNHAESSQIFGGPPGPGGHPGPGGPHGGPPGTMPPMMSPSHSNGLLPPHPHSMHGTAPPYPGMPPYDSRMVSNQ